MFLSLFNPAAKIIPLLDRENIGGGGIPPASTWTPPQETPMLVTYMLNCYWRPAYAASADLILLPSDMYVVLEESWFV